jgi:hypothetical protein
VARGQPVKRIFPKGTTEPQMVAAVARMVQGLDPARVWSIEVTEWKKPKTNQQSRYLFGVVYPMIMEAAGESLRGFTRDDLHDFFLGEIWGWETIEGFGRKRLRPLKRTSRMTKQEFTEYLYGIENKCIEMGIGPLPEPIHVED